jgi:Arc/MetJ-type ribon-helix-helix transcriptional regulator
LPYSRIAFSFYATGLYAPRRVSQIWSKAMSEPAVTVRLPARLREELTAYAKSAHTNQSAVIVAALQEYLASRDRQRHIQMINDELRRLDKIERNDPGLREFYERNKNPWENA